MNVLTPVVDKAAEIPAIDFVEKVDCPRVRPAELERGFGDVAAEGRLVAQPVPAKDVFRCAPDNRFSARRRERTFVSLVDFLNDRICKIISTRKIGRVRPSEKGSNPLKRNLASLSGDGLNKCEVTLDEVFENRINFCFR